MTRFARMLFLLVLGSFAMLPVTHSSAAPYDDPTVVSVSQQTPDEGGSLTFSGSGYASGENIDLILHSTPISLGTTVANAAGAFSAVVTLPDGITGAHTLEALGRTSHRSSVVAITIEAPAAAAGGGLPLTGFALMGTVAAGLAALLVGVFLVTAARRRAVQLTTS